MQALCPRRVASTKLRMVLGFQIWASKRSVVKTMKAKSVAWDSQVADIERPLIAASQLAAAGNRVTFKAQGGEIEHINSGRKMMLVKKGGIYVLRMWVAANDPNFPRPCEVGHASNRVLYPVRPEEQLTSKSSVEDGVRSGHARKNRVRTRERSVPESAAELA